MAGVAQAYQHLLTIDCLLFSGVLADLDPLDLDSRLKSAALDPPTELSENIILNVLVEIDNTLRFSAY